MKILLIGGTGTISAAISDLLVRQGHDLYLLNRGSRRERMPEKAHLLQGNMDNEREIAALLSGQTFDVVGEFIGFVPEQVQRDVRLFSGKCGQYIYISSASAYHKPVRDYRITEGTALANPYWQYSRNKIACEDYLMAEYRENGFPVTIVHPSHTYDDRSMPVGIHGANGSWQVLKRTLEGKPVLIPGDGSSLWTLTYNEDFAKGYVGLMGNPHTIGEAFQITSDETLTWMQIHETIARLMGKKLVPYTVSSDFLASVAPQYDYRGGLIGDKSCSVVFDNSKLKKAVPGFCPNIRFEQGAQKVLDNVLAHPELQREDPDFDRFCDRVINALEKAKQEVLENA